MLQLLQSLKFQIVFAIALLTALFAGATLYSLNVIDQQHSDDVLVTLASQLQFNQQNLTVQAMRYQENAPRDYDSYFRDLRLYFEDLKKNRAELTRLIEAFANNNFDAAAIGGSMTIQPQLANESLEIAEELGHAWQAFLIGLDQRIGPNPAEPRLEWAAEWIVDHHAGLEETAGRLFMTLRNDVAERASRASTVNRLLLVFALVVAFGIAIWFYSRVLGPLTTAVNGFRQVANGDFAYRVPVEHHNEIGSLAGSFNHLSDRLDALRKLLTGLEQGADLDGTLRTLSTTLPSLIPVDWIGVLVTGADGYFHLERAFSDGNPDRVGTLRFVPDQTLLAECINNREPLHIPDVTGMAALSEHYVFLHRLSELGRRDAIFLPIGHGPLQGVAVFASRYPNNFRAEHLALLRNLGVLLGVSLGRTIQLTESSRLASIGQFASGIVHEIRNPLATIALALDHLQGLESLPAGSAKRVALASTEVSRLERLLADILLYAKPLTLERAEGDITVLVHEVIAAEGGNTSRFDVDLSPCPPVPIDRDRMRQVLLNLIRNAQEATPGGGSIGVHCAPAEDDWIDIQISNAGEPVSPRVLERIFEPFVTTKHHGTGLGLPIVQRIVEAHGGRISMTSDALDGTRVSVRLPSARATLPGSDQAADSAPS